MWISLPTDYPSIANMLFVFTTLPKIEGEQTKLEMNKTSYEGGNGVAARPTQSRNYKILTACILAFCVVYIFGRVFEFLDRYGNQHHILGDCSWWGRKTWFWTVSAQDMPSLTIDGYRKVGFTISLES